jgi:hypothetical protein
MANKKAQAKAPKPTASKFTPTEGRLDKPKPIISVVDGKLAIRATSDSFPSSFTFQHFSPIQPERIDQFLNPGFISRLAAKLWDGDDVASIKKAISLIKVCAGELARRKSPIADIEWLRPPGSKPSRRNSRFWRRIPLESVIEIAACVDRSGQLEDTVKRAFSIIENARTTLERESEIPDEKLKDDLVTKTEAVPSDANWASGLPELWKPHWTWKDAVKRITRNKRFYRAESAFHRFLKDPCVRDRVSLPDNILKRAISGRKKQGFSLGEVRALETEFKYWHTRWVRSRQREAGSKFGTKNLRRKSP